MAFLIAHNGVHQYILSNVYDRECMHAVFTNPPTANTDVNGFREELTRM